MRLVFDANLFDSAARKEASWPGMVILRLDEAGGLLESAATEGQVENAGQG